MEFLMVYIIYNNQQENFYYLKSIISAFGYLDLGYSNTDAAKDCPVFI